MAYLQAAEYQQYGLAAEIADATVGTASALIEAYCRRPTLMAASYTERLRLTEGAQTVRLSYGPIETSAVTFARARYSRGRRGEQAELQGSSFGMQIANAFGLPGTWTTLDVSTLDVNVGAREVTFPANLLGIAFNEAEITYTAGFVTVPDAIKYACAQVVRNAQATPALNVSRSRMDTMQMEYFSASLLDDGVKLLLKPYVAERL